MKKIIILLALTYIPTMKPALFSQNLRHNYKQVVKEGLERTSEISKETLSKSDLAHLPALLQTYLELAGLFKITDADGAGMDFCYGEINLHLTNI